MNSNQSQTKPRWSKEYNKQSYEATASWHLFEQEPPVHTIDLTGFSIIIAVLFFHNLTREMTVKNGAGMKESPHHPKKLPSPEPPVRKNSVIARHHKKIRRARIQLGH